MIIRPKAVYQTKGYKIFYKDKLYNRSKCYTSAVQFSGGACKRFFRLCCPAGGSYPVYLCLGVFSNWLCDMVALGLTRPWGDPSSWLRGRP